MGRSREARLDFWDEPHATRTDGVQLTGSWTGRGIFHGK
jgi:hypothetical protein